MLCSCSEFFANQCNMRNFKVICRSISLLNRNTGKLLDVPRRKNLTSSDMGKVSGSQSLLDLTPAVENKQIYIRIHNSSPARSGFKGVNQRKEEIKNYIFFAVLGGVCLSMFVFSMTMRTHEDYVYVNPNAKNK